MCSTGLYCVRAFPLCRRVTPSFLLVVRAAADLSLPEAALWCFLQPVSRQLSRILTCELQCSVGERFGVAA
jgi:hypothetical protein